MNTRDVMVGAGVGAALAFMLDPQGGGRRRALVRDKMVRASRRTRDGVDAAARDISNRTRGIAARARHRWSSDNAEVDDRRLVERVRAQLGHVTSHPRAIDVHADDGEITLYGPVLTSEMVEVVRLVASVAGVRNVVNELEPHETAKGVPSLQGDGRATDGWLRIPRAWPPATRLLATASLAATGVCVAAYARRHATR